jgi:hypothetical protein
VEVPVHRRLTRLLVLAVAMSSVSASGLGVGGAGPAAVGPSGIATRFTTIPGTPLPQMTCQVVTVDLGAATITPLGPLLQTELCPVDYAARDDGRIYGVTLTGLTTQDPSPLVLVDAATGVQTVVGSTGIHVTDIGGLEFDAAGTLWFYGKTAEHDCENGAPCLYRIDPETALATFVGQEVTPTPGFIGGLTRACVDPLYTNFIESAPEDGEADAGRVPSALSPEGVAATQVGLGILSNLDTATAQLGEIGGLGGTTSAGGLAFAQDGTLWAIVASALAPPRTYSSATIDPSTGAVTLVATLPVSDDTTAFETMTGLTFGPLDCVAPVVLAPTFTG